MNHRSALPLLAFLVAITAPAAAVEFPVNTDLAYQLERSGVTLGTMERSISREEASRGSEFRVESVARPEGMARLLFRGETREIARFELIDGAIRPLYYRYRQRTGKEKDYELTFHWDEMRVEESHSGEEWALMEDAQDTLSSQFAIMHGLEQGGRSFRFTLVDEDGPDKEYHYMVVGREPVETPAGTFSAIKVRQMREDPDKRHNIFWLAEEFGYLPVHSEERRNGRRTMVLTLTRAPD
ncbi:MAG: DUF3108 domain-containing protein [Pseudomonadota bacterium]